MAVQRFRQKLQHKWNFMLKRTRLGGLASFALLAWGEVSVQWRRLQPPLTTSILAGQKMGRSVECRQAEVRVGRCRASAIIRRRYLARLTMAQPESVTPSQGDLRFLRD